MATAEASTDLTNESTPDDHRNGAPGAYDVTVRTPAGFTHVFRVTAALRVDMLSRRAVEFFTAQGQLTGSGWRLVLVDDGRTRDLVASAHVGDADVEEGAMLALVTTDPQVGGS
jgi:hypothetical protein